MEINEYQTHESERTRIVNCGAVLIAFGLSDRESDDDGRNGLNEWKRHVFLLLLIMDG